MHKVAYYIQYWGSNDAGPRRHSCPWMLVEIVGEIGISGAVWACDHPCSQPLSDYVPFLPIASDTRSRFKQARLCMAIWYGFTALKSFCETEPNEENLQAGFPYQKDCALEIDNQEYYTTL